MKSGASGVDSNDPASLAIAGQAVDANSTKEICPWVDSIALRTAGLRHRTLTFSKANRLAEEFLVNTRQTRNDRESEASILHYYEDASTLMLSMAEHVDPAGLKSVSLPKSVPLRMELGEAIRLRRSHRVYTGDPLPLDYLATIVRSAMGYTGAEEVDLRSGAQVTLRFRSTPSGGRLLPVQLCIAATNVSKLNKGLYGYDAITDSLYERGGASAVDMLLGAMASPEEVLSARRADAILLLIAKPWRTMRKYGARGMRFVFMEAGYIAQNIHLATTALGFGSVDCASIYDDEVHDALNIDGLFETLVHTVVIGCK